MLALHEVSHHYPGGVVALEQVSLALHPGEFVAVVGPSGCGKSTLLSLLAGLTAPVAGRVSSVVRSPGELGMVFQDPTLMPWASVAENIALPLRLMRRPAGEVTARVVEAVRQVGLAGFEASLPAELSGGMRMRVAIARALVTRPRLLLMDEPFAALDELTRERMNEQLLALWRELGITCLFVTHSLYEAVFLATRVLVMAPRPGRVIAEVAVPAGYPRGDAWRSDAAFAALRGELAAQLRHSAEPASP
ncbi:MAG: ABC transporter ATP-binding protein [Gammaproteobacteria bacterium]|nr:ABC transporter ATP-binding protein [Gammaproteobacteria bacterium]TVQ47954.1 MAG: ABC transporter ATP-binding protein [Gammaproteobacteria bacterium]